MNANWHLEYDDGEELYTESNVTVDSIRNTLDMVDGENTFFCALCDDSDGSHLCCGGDSSRLIIEGQFKEDNYATVCFVRPGAGKRDTIKLRIAAGVEPQTVVEVYEEELSTKQQALEFFLMFYQAGLLPPIYEKRRRASRLYPSTDTV